MRQSFASSTTLRGRLPLCCSSFDSNRAKRANASAVDPAKPDTIFPLYRRRSLRAPLFKTSLPIVTWPSPAKTTLPLRRTHRIVVERILLLIEPLFHHKDALRKAAAE